MVEVKVTQLCPTLCDPMDYTVQGILQARHWSGEPFPSPGDLPNPGIELRSPALQTNSLPAEPLMILMVNEGLFGGEEGATQGTRLACRVEAGARESWCGTRSSVPRASPQSQRAEKGPRVRVLAQVNQSKNTFCREAPEHRGLDGQTPWAHQPTWAALGHFLNTSDIEWPSNIADLVGCWEG